MTKYKKIEINCSFNASYVLFNKSSFVEFSRFNKSDWLEYLKIHKYLPKLAKDTYVEFSPSGKFRDLYDMPESSGTNDVLSSAHSIGETSDIYCSKEDPIKEIFISTTDIELYDKNEKVLLNENTLKDTLKISKCFSNKKNYKSIHLSSEELVVYSLASQQHVVLKAPSGTHTIYEIYDDSYLKNIQELKEMYEDGKVGDEHSFGHWLDDFREWEKHPPNIHFLYLNFE